MYVCWVFRYVFIYVYVVRSIFMYVYLCPIVLCWCVVIE